MSKKDVCVFDIEAVRWTEFIRGGVYDGIRFFLFDEIGPMLDKILEYEYAYGYNNSKYDNNFILEYVLNNNKYKINNIIINNGKNILLKIKKTAIKDLILFTHCSLRQACLNYGLQDNKGTIDYDNMINLDKSIIDDYLKTDLKVTYQLYNKLNNDFNVNKHYTIAGVAINEIKKRTGLDFKYNKKNQWIENTIDIYGGRVELFKTENNDNKKVIYTDINSLYPSVFVNNDIPYDIINEVTYSDYNNNKKNMTFLLLIDYNDNHKIPYYPVRIENELYYFNGIKKNIYVYSDNIPDEKNIIKIHKIYLCDIIKKDNFITLNEMYNKRKDNIFYKRVMNSFYGKFLQKPIRDKYKIVYDKQNYMHYIKKGYQEEIINSNFIMLKKETFNPYSFHNRFIGKYITDKARFILTKQLNIINEKTDLLYCDTDSIVFEDYNGYENDFIITNKIGNYKIEGIYEKGYFYSPKHYKLTGNSYIDIYKYKGGHEYIKMSIKDTMKTGRFNHKKIIKTIMSDYKNKKKLLDNNKYVYYNYNELKKG